MPWTMRGKWQSAWTFINCFLIGNLLKHKVKTGRSEVMIHSPLGPCLWNKRPLVSFLLSKPLISLTYFSFMSKPFQTLRDSRTVVSTPLSLQSNYKEAMNDQIWFSNTPLLMTGLLSSFLLSLSFSFSLSLETSSHSTTGRPQTTYVGLPHFELTENLLPQPFLLLGLQAWAATVDQFSFDVLNRQGNTPTNREWVWIVNDYY